jgi:hypothetical protein
MRERAPPDPAPHTPGVHGFCGVRGSRRVWVAAGPAHRGLG